MKDYIKKGFFLTIIALFCAGLFSCGTGLFVPEGDPMTLADLPGGGASGRSGSSFPNSCCPDLGYSTVDCDDIECTCGSAEEGGDGLFGGFFTQCFIKDCCDVEGEEPVSCDETGCSCIGEESSSDCTF